MISRATALAIGESYKLAFSYTTQRSGSGVYRDTLYDFLFTNDFEPWFCNLAKAIYEPRTLKEWIMKLHTGETQVGATPGWTWDKRKLLGQQYLKNLGECIVSYWKKPAGSFYADRNQQEAAKLIAQFELDGYIFRDGQLIPNESDVMNVEEETNIIVHLAKKHSFQRMDVISASLALSEKHYIEGLWADSISNSRKAFECVLGDTAEIFATKKSIPLSDAQKSRPVEIRDFLQEHGLLEMKEKEAIAKLYGLLSHTGSHPYMAEKDQARLLRQLSLTLAQFVQLRLEGALGHS